MNLTDVVFQLVLPWERPVSHISTALTSISDAPKRRSRSCMGPIMMPSEIVHSAKCFVVALEITTLEGIGTRLLVAMDTTNHCLRLHGVCKWSFPSVHRLIEVAIKLVWQSTRVPQISAFRLTTSSAVLRISAVAQCFLAKGYYLNPEWISEVVVHKPCESHGR
jgi:hypothetical protein